MQLLRVTAPLVVSSVTLLLTLLLDVLLLQQENGLLEVTVVLNLSLTPGALLYELGILLLALVLEGFALFGPAFDPALLLELL